MATVRRENPKAFEILNTRLTQLGDATSKVGWFESAHYEDGRPVAAVAAGNELGIPARSIPARPFFRPTASEQEGKWREVAGMMAKRVLAGKATAFDAMEALALQAEGDVLATIASIFSPPLSDITIAARKYKKQGKKISGAVIGEIASKLKNGGIDVTGVSTKPLDDSGHMIATLTHITEVSA